ncbi:MAG: SpoIIE family protein phosphatase [Gemmataceae bacterium]|nr:SpoIIE family protein phosphatase [Gemmataceae bacterium]
MSTSIPLLLCADPQGDTAAWRQALAQAGFDVALKSLDDPEPINGEPVRMVVVQEGAEPEAALGLCRRLKARPTENFVPILYLGGDAAQRRASLDLGADVHLTLPLAPTDLIAQIAALLRIKDRHDQLNVKAAEANRTSKRLQAAYHQIDQELELARRIQESFLPQTLPVVPQVRFAVKYRPCNRVGGDFYDVFRLDEHHLGFYVADAMGHGVPASLLTIYVKKGVKPKEISGSSYRLVPPDEVLRKLNRDMIEQELSDTPFITMIYGLLDQRDGTLKFSRAGHPYPLLIPREGPIQSLQMEGSLLGVFETNFTIQTRKLAMGDKLLLYTDGMDAASYRVNPTGLTSLMAAIDDFRSLPIESLVDRLSHDLFQQTRQSDDFTLFGIESLV